jgi:MFS transporter, ACS family, hexuronate transporter
LFLWSLAGIAHAFARGVASFASARFALGFGESSNFPAAIKSTAEWFPKKERAFATGLFNSGSAAGAIIAPVIVSGITVSMGWQWAFILTGSLGFIWIAFWLKLYRSPSEHPKITRKELDHINQDTSYSEEETGMRWVHLFRYKQTAAICATRFLSDWIWWFFLFWIPDFLSKTHGINIREVVLPLIIIYLFSSLGGIGGGWISSKLIKSGKNINYSRKMAVFICACFVVPLMFVTRTDNIWVAVVLISLAAAGHQGWASNIFTIVSDIFPKSSVGTMTGLSGFAGAAGGALSASFVGFLLQTTNSYFLIFTVASVMYLVNWLILIVFIPVIQPVKENENYSGRD